MGRLCSQMLRARQFARQAVPCGRRAFTSGKTMRAGVKYENMTIGIVKETLPLERRVAQSPESVGKLVKEGFKVVVEKNAGALSTFSDAMYEAAGATIVDSKAAWSADFVTKVRIPTSAEAAKVEIDQDTKNMLRAMDMANLPGLNVVNHKERPRYGGNREG